MKIQFIKETGMTKVNRQRLLQINSVINDYAAQGYKLTLRQLYYQLVTKNIVPNNDKEYAKLGNLLTKGRLLGIVDWNAIEDRVRIPRHVYEVDDIEDAISDTERHYRLDRMKDQGNYIELWVEKDALSSVLSRKTQHYHVRLMVNRGYSSTTAMFDAYERFVAVMEEGKKVNVLYLGDHDPSGLDMIRDIKSRILRMLIAQPKGIEDWFNENVTEDMEDELRGVADDYFTNHPEDEFGLLDDTMEINPLNFYIYTHFDINHIGLTSEQVRQYNPPPNPAKLKDPRSKWYLENFGRTSWEVDALNPVTLHEIIDKGVLSLIDVNKFNEVLEREKKDKVTLSELPRVKEKYDAAVRGYESLEDKYDDLTAEHDRFAGKVTLIKDVVNKVNLEVDDKMNRIRLAKLFGERLSLIKEIVNS